MEAAFRLGAPWHVLLGVWLSLGMARHAGAQPEAASSTPPTTSSAPALATSTPHPTNANAQASAAPPAEGPVEDSGTGGGRGLMPTASPRSSARAGEAQVPGAAASDDLLDPKLFAEDELTAALPAPAPGAPSESERLLAGAARALDAVELRQAQLEWELQQRELESARREEALLRLARRAREALEGRLAPGTIYDELELTLQRAQRALRLISQTSPPRVPGPPPAVGQGLLALGIDTAQLDERRDALEKGKLRLEGAIARDRAQRLALLHGGTVELNRARLALLPKLSAERRRLILGPNLSALKHAGTELTQVELTLRYHWFIAVSWFSERIAQRNVGAAPTVELGVSALVLTLVVTVFAMVRSRFAAMMVELRARNGRSVRTLGRQAAARNARGLDVLERTFSPATWLVFILLVSWLLPAPLRQPVEVRLLLTTLSWWAGARLVIALLDVLLADRRVVQPQMAVVRLRSLRLLVGTAVAVGLVLALGRHLVDEGTIHYWLRSLAWLSVVPTLVLLAYWWRPVLVSRLSRSTRTRARERWLLHRLEGNLGLAFTPLAVLHLSGKRLSRWSREQMESRVYARKLLAYLFQRELEKRGGEPGGSQLGPVPDAIWQAFDPGKREASKFVAPADDELARALSGQHRVVAYVGERGAGKSATLAGALDEALRVVWVDGAASVTQLARNLARASGLPESGDCAALAKQLDARDERVVVVLDDVEELVQPRIGGIDPFDRLMDAILPATERVTWVLTFDEAVWNFLEVSRGAHPTFDAVVHARPWDEADIRDLIRARLEALGADPDFSLLVPTLPAGTDDWERDEEAEKAEASYFRLLWDYSAGNPAVALHAFRSSLGLGAGGTLHVKPFKPPKVSELEELSDSSALILRAAYVLGESTLEDVMALTLDSRRAVEQTLRHFEARGILEQRSGKTRITWAWYRATSTYLARRHLIASRRAERFA